MPKYEYACKSLWRAPRGGAVLRGRAADRVPGVRRAAAQGLQRHRRSRSRAAASTAPTAASAGRANGAEGRQPRSDAKADGRLVTTPAVAEVRRRSRSRPRSPSPGPTRAESEARAKASRGQVGLAQWPARRPRSASSAAPASTPSSTTSRRSPSRRRTGRRRRRWRWARVAGRRVAFLARHGAGPRASPPTGSTTGPTCGPCAAWASAGCWRPARWARCSPHLRPGDFVVCDQLVDRTSRPGRHLLRRAGARPRLLRRPVLPRAGPGGRRRGRDEGVTGARDGHGRGHPGPPVLDPGRVRAGSPRPGWDVVNMTQYPEAVLARELGLCYSGIWPWSPTTTPALERRSGSEAGHHGRRCSGCWPRTSSGCKGVLLRAIPGHSRPSPAAACAEGAMDPGSLPRLSLPPQLLPPPSCRPRPEDRAVRLRRLTRSPFAYWAAVVALAAFTAFTVAGQVGRAEAQAARYGRLRPVVVATRAVEAGHGRAGRRRRSCGPCRPPFLPEGAVAATGEVGGAHRRRPAVPGRGGGGRQPGARRARGPGRPAARRAPGPWPCRPARRRWRCGGATGSTCWPPSTRRRPAQEPTFPVAEAALVVDVGPEAVAVAVDPEEARAGRLRRGRRAW